MKLLKIKALAGTLCAVFLISAFAVLPAKAATAFDPNYYYDKYPDVAAEWRAAAGHVDTAEERTAFLMQIPPADPANAASELPRLDPYYYYNTYPDVAAAIGNDPQALLNHYFAYGYAEGRLPFYGAEPCTEVQTSY